MSKLDDDWSKQNSRLSEFLKDFKATKEKQLFKALIMVNSVIQAPNNGKLIFLGRNLAESCFLSPCIMSKLDDDWSKQNSRLSEFLKDFKATKEKQLFKALIMVNSVIQAPNNGKLSYSRP